MVVSSEINRTFLIRLDSWILDASKLLLRAFFLFKDYIVI